MTVIDYEVVSARSTANQGATRMLVEKVRAMLLEGWEPLGGVDVDDEIMRQAMVKRSPASSDSAADR